MSKSKEAIGFAFGFGFNGGDLLPMEKVALFKILRRGERLSDLASVVTGWSENDRPGVLRVFGSVREIPADSFFATFERLFDRLLLVGLLERRRETSRFWRFEGLRERRRPVKRSRISKRPLSSRASSVELHVGVGESLRTS